MLAAMPVTAEEGKEPDPRPPKNTEGRKPTQAGNRPGKSWPWVPTGCLLSRGWHCAGTEGHLPRLPGAERVRPESSSISIWSGS